MTGWSSHEQKQYKSQKLLCSLLARVHYKKIEEYRPFGTLSNIDTFLTAQQNFAMVGALA